MGRFWRRGQQFIVETDPVCSATKFTLESSGKSGRETVKKRASQSVNKCIPGVKMFARDVLLLV
jgi:hypothetical protein